MGGGGSTLPEMYFLDSAPPVSGCTVAPDLNQLGLYNSSWVYLTSLLL